MRVYDVSMPITTDMQVYKNRDEKRPAFDVTRDHPEGGDGVRESRAHLDVHTGTHIDAPLHMLKDGAGIEQIPLDRLLGPCRVVDLRHVADAIHREDLEPLDVRPGDFLLLQTRNSAESTFNPGFVYLAADGAAYLAERRSAGVGIDALGVERDQPDHATHKALFAAGMVVIEGLRLADVPSGRYWMAALPLPFVGLDAAPARVVLMKTAPAG
ncbi:MAG: cyclase family protein [Alicyclobacillus sp.]|nr:cyclase family protein [Alicyclobacillus sp.]